MIGLCATVALTACLAYAANEPKWQLVSSSHFLIVTNADYKQAHEVAARFEQMRQAYGQLLLRQHVSLPEPVTVVALRTQEDYSAVAPTKAGPLLGDAFFIPGDDRYYFCINLSKPEAWRAISYDYGKLLMYYNYPPVQGWFDEGFAQYFSSANFGRAVVIGGEPVSIANRTAPFIPTLSGQAWSATAPMLTASPADPAFPAESWIFMHYLMNSDKMEATGNYFDLVENQKVAPDAAIQQAYAMPAAQLDAEVKSYFQKVLPVIQAPPPTGKNAVAKSPGQAPAVPADEEIVTSEQDLNEATGHAWVAEMAVRLPEHRAAAVNQLNAMVAQPQTDNNVAHRALAYADMLNRQWDDAMRELGQANQLDPKDPWPHFYSAYFKFLHAQATGKETDGLANMMQDLKTVLDWSPEFASADNMLGVARLEGGGLNSAMQSERAAIALSPRNLDYQLNMAKIYMAAKQWEAAEALLKRLSAGPDTKVAQQAKQQLEILPNLKKYGIAQPVNAPAGSGASAAGAAASGSATVAAAQLSAAANPGPQPAENDEIIVEDEEGPRIDRRPVLFAKGKVVAVDCSQQPVATITFFTGAKTLKLRTENYQNLTLIDVPQFNCNWANRPASVNYKAGGKADGDLVSLEVR
jgi:tetratricopeptide (TPR) repeat protein